MKEFSLRQYFILALLTQIFLSCSGVLINYPSIDSLQSTFIDGYIYANLGPVVPPDPISCQLVFQLINTNQSETLYGINIREAEVYLIDSNQKVGDIDLITTWDGILYPHELTTVVLEKPMGQDTPFKSPCGQGVSINVIARDKSDSFTILKVDSLMFMCSW